MYANSLFDTGGVRRKGQASIKVMGAAAAALVFAGVCAPATGMAQMTGMTIGSGSVGADFFAFGSGLEKSLTKAFPNLKFENTVSRGSVENLRLLHRKEIDLGMVSISGSTRGAMTGTGRFKGEPPYTELRAIASLWTFNYAVMTMASSSIKSIHDLKGKKIAIGPSPATQDPQAAPLFAAHGIDYMKDMERFYASYAEIYRLLGEGRYDAAMGYTSGFKVLPAILQLAEGKDVRWISLEADKLEKDGIVPVHMPPGTLPDQDNPMVFAQRGLVMLAGTDRISDSAAYELAKTLHKSVGGLAESVAAVGQAKADPTKLLQDVSPFPVHSGALRYWKEAGIAK